MRRTGKFEQAQGGTIFLDEIGEMKPSLQAKLLRVLQEREIQRVGGMVDIPVDVRVIAATNQKLERSMKVGEFREDLYYRIAVFPIRIPPLRQRRDDIAPLVEHFFESCVKEMGRNLRGITTEAMRLLVSYHWPGNVRELENIIQRAILLETSHSIQANNPAIQEIAATEPDVADGMLPVMPLDELERRAIVTALETTERNVTQAATLLGINRATIYRKLKRYGIEP